MISRNWILAVGLLFIFGFFLIGNGSVSGFAIVEDSAVQYSPSSGFAFVDNVMASGGNTGFTREDAVHALNESRDIIKEMKDANFTGELVEDSLIEAERILQQVDLAEILRGNVEASFEEQNSARRDLALVNWKYINYSDILEHTEEIKEVRELAFLVQDLLSLQESFLGAVRDESGEIVSFSKIKDVDLERFKFLINEVERAIGEARYGDAKILAEELNEEVDIRRTEVFTALVLSKSLGSLLLRYWYFTLLGLAALGLGGYSFFRVFRLTLLKRKIRMLKIEQKVIMALMKKAQVERFKQNKISGIVYNIRMEKFSEKLSSIKEDLPVLEERVRGEKKEGKVSNAKRVEKNEEVKENRKN